MGHKCISCGSTQLQFTNTTALAKRGYGAGKGLIGVLVLGPLGLLFGFAGSRKTLKHASNDVFCGSCLATFSLQDLKKRKASRGGVIAVAVALVLFVFAVLAAGCAGRSLYPEPTQSVPFCDPVVGRCDFADELQFTPQERITCLNTGRSCLVDLQPACPFCVGVAVCARCD